ncbi:MAG: tRNA lysidine(34) synthetase TilS [Clostridia bacterium]|nr:tRNA lysidine(34) synthetase TilS [Clostridia bacterium]
MPIIRKVKKFIQQNSLIRSGDRVLVALSGGGDSVALLHILHALSRELEFSVLAAHFNHRIRGKEADRDEEFSRALCQRLGISFCSGSADIPRLAAESGMGIEECAREQRYGFLFKAAEEYGCNRLATAHHATDNVETVLFHTARGSGTNGIGGIAPMRRDGVIRPLLSCSRAEIESYLKDGDLEYVTDSTNSDKSVTRNFIRGDVLPLLRRINPSLESAFERLSSDAREDEEYFVSQAEKIPADAPLSLLATVPMPILRRYIRARFDSCKQTRAQLEHQHLREICKEIVAGNKRFRISLPGKAAAIADGKHLVFIEDKLEAEPYEVRLTGFGEYSVGNGNIFLSESEEELSRWLESHREGVTAVYGYDGSDKGFPELTARSRLPGDRYLRGGIHRAVRKELNSIGYPAYKRDSLPCLCDSDGIFWVPGLLPRDMGKNKDKPKSKQLIYIGYTEN